MTSSRARGSRLSCLLLPTLFTILSGDMLLGCGSQALDRAPDSGKTEAGQRHSKLEQLEKYSDFLQKVELSPHLDNPIQPLCLDGTAYSFFVHVNNDAAIEEWVVFLAGGGFCADEQECRDDVEHDRSNIADLSPQLFTNTLGGWAWPDKVPAANILSANATINPVFARFNKVFLPYCSKDLWSGRVAAPAWGNIYFRGNIILEAVLHTLSTLHGFANASQVLLAGSSAGGIGAGLYSPMVAAVAPNAAIRLLIDSSIFQGPARMNNTHVNHWLLNSVPYVGTLQQPDGNQATNYTNIMSMAAEVAFRDYIATWASAIPAWCATELPPQLQSRCMLLDYVLPALPYPKLLMGTRFDSYAGTLLNVTSDAVLGGAGPALIAMHEIATSMLHTYLQLQALAPSSLSLVLSSCYQHTIFYPIQGDLFTAEGTALHRWSTDFFIRLNPTGLGSGGLPYEGYTYLPDIIRTKLPLEINDQSVASPLEILSSWFTMPENMSFTVIEHCDDMNCNPTCPIKPQRVAINELTAKIHTLDYLMIASACAFMAVLLLLGAVNLGHTHFFWKRTAATVHAQMHATPVDSAATVMQAVGSFKRSDADTSASEVSKAVRQQTLTRTHSNHTCYHHKHHQAGAWTGFQHVTRAASLACLDLSYFATDSTKSCSYDGMKTDKNRQLLHKVTAAFLPGLTAMMGPSGAGKTTLMDCLSLRRNGGRMEGAVVVGGRPITLGSKAHKQFVCSTGFVEQFPQLPENLNAVEAMVLQLRLLQAGIRLDHGSIEAEVAHVIQLVGMAPYALTPVSGLSGGQKQHLAVALELLRKPSVLFMDEPTSGLDATSTLTLLNMLRSACQVAHVTILMTIHQPRLEAYECLNNMLLLVAGHVAYYGAASKGMDYFRCIADCGLLPSIQETGLPYHYNPADCIMDLVKLPGVDKDSIQAYAQVLAPLHADTVLDLLAHKLEPGARSCMALSSSGLTDDCSDATVKANITISGMLPNEADVMIGSHDATKPSAFLPASIAGCSNSSRLHQPCESLVLALPPSVVTGVETNSHGHVAVEAVTPFQRLMRRCNTLGSFAHHSNRVRSTNSMNNELFCQPVPPALQPTDSSADSHSRQRNAPTGLIDRAAYCVRHQIAQIHTQLVLLLTENILRRLGLYLMEVAVAAVLGLALGCILYTNGYDDIAHLKRVTYVFFICIVASAPHMMYNVVRLEGMVHSFHKDARAFTRSTLGFIVAQVLYIAIAFAPHTIATLTCSYFLAGMKMQLTSYLFTIVVGLWCQVVTGVAMLSTAAAHTHFRAALAVVYVSGSCIMTDTIIPVESMPAMASWLNYISYAGYAMPVAALTNMKDMPLHCSLGDVGSRCLNQGALSVLVDSRLTKRLLWQNILGLLGLPLLFATCAYVWSKLWVAYLTRATKQVHIQPSQLEEVRQQLSQTPVHPVAPQVFTIPQQLLHTCSHSGQQ